MKNSIFDVGIFTVELTVYKTGNVHICFTNRLTGEKKMLLTKNPLIFHKQPIIDNYTV